MYRALTFFVAAVISVPVTSGADVKVKVTLAGANDTSSPTTRFAADVPAVVARFSAEGVQAGDKLRSLWIAEDVGDAAPKGSKIDEKTLTAEGSTADGTFSLGKPEKGWPPGKYKLEVYVNEKLASTTDFSIGGAPNATKVPGPAGKVPDQAELKSMTNRAIQIFGDAIKQKDFSGFYHEIAGLWQEQTSAEDLGESFKDFYDKDIDLAAATKGLEPVFDKPAKIDSNGVLVVEGYYPTKPNRIVFILKYITEAGERKLVGINVNLKE